MFQTSFFINSELKNKFQMLYLKQMFLHLKILVKITFIIFVQKIVKIIHRLFNNTLYSCHYNIHNNWNCIIIKNMQFLNKKIIFYLFNPIYLLKNINFYYILLIKFNWLTKCYINKSNKISAKVSYSIFSYWTYYYTELSYLTFLSRCSIKLSLFRFIFYFIWKSFSWRSKAKHHYMTLVSSGISKMCVCSMNSI